MSTEQERVQKMMSDKAQGDETGKQLVWDPVSKTIRAPEPSDPDRETLSIDPSDMEHFSRTEGDCCITLSQDWLAEHRQREVCLPRQFRRLDEGDAYSDLGAESVAGTVRGSVLVTGRPGPSEADRFGHPEDQVRLIARWGDPQLDPKTGPFTVWQVTGFVRTDRVWREAGMQVAPVRAELFSRSRGLLETDILADKSVFEAGLGSGGAPIALEMVKLGIMNHILMDPDRIEVGNVGRHVAGLSDVGRRKTRFVAEAICNKNPCAAVETSNHEIGWQTQDLVRSFVRRSDLVICAVDDRVARIILNKICVEEGKPLIIAGAFRRAYGGQVLFVRPGLTPCYECFLACLPEKARDEEVSDPEQAARLAYSDRPVAIEPGLSNDIAPISQMVVKLALQYLINGRATTLKSLDEDLVAPWYIWLNRREAGTEYKDLKPLEFNVDGLHVMRWYGVHFDRNPACPCCGDFLSAAARAEGFVTQREEIEAFAQEMCL